MRAAWWPRCYALPRSIAAGGGVAARRAGVFSHGPALLTLRVRPGVAVKVTVERAGGVDQPTTQPILGAQV